MPNYEDDIKEAGWVKDGKHWVHPDKPGVKYWAPIEVYEKETFPGKRPYSAVPPDKPAEPAAAPKPAAAPQAKATAPTVTAAKAAPKPVVHAKPEPKPEPKHHVKAKKKGKR